MTKIKMINGDLNLTEKALEILPFALQFYGDKYKQVVLNTLKYSYLYEWNDENKQEILEKIIGRKVGVPNNDVEGFYFFKDNLEKGHEHIVTIKETKISACQKLVLTHELFGHAVLSNVKPFIKENDILYQRNGLAKIEYFNRKKCFNITINEGIVEYIAEEIMRLYDKNFKSVNFSLKYLESISVARLLFEFIGKEKMLDLLVLNKGNINALFNPNDIKEWDMLALELEHEKPVISDYVLRFIRRHQ